MLQQPTGGRKGAQGLPYARGAEHVLSHSIADLAAECGRLDADFAALRSRAAGLDQFYLTTRSPNALAGGILVEAFTADDARRALDMTREVLATVKRHIV